MSLIHGRLYASTIKPNVCKYAVGDKVRLCNNRQNKTYNEGTVTEVYKIDETEFEISFKTVEGRTFYTTQCNGYCDLEKVK
jgi:hypothetical protein